MSATDTTNPPGYAPVPASAVGPALNEQGYYVGQVERNLYWVTDGTYNSAFLVARRRQERGGPPQPQTVSGVVIELISAPRFDGSSD